MEREMTDQMEEITDIMQVQKYIGKHVYVEAGWNPYLTGYRFVYNRRNNGIQYFSDGSKGFACAMEVRSNGVHGDSGLTTGHMEKGYLKVRLATEEEWTPRKFSYNSDGRGW